MPVLHTFGDSILDCPRYNAHGVHPGALLVRNDDQLFPEFRGRDLAPFGFTLAHHAIDGATLPTLARQLPGARVEPEDIAIVTIGGNDLLGGLMAADAARIDEWGRRLGQLLSTLPRGRVLVGNVYDPTFGNDAHNFTGVDPKLARANLERMNALLAELGAQHGGSVDIHGRFLERGDPSWFTMVIEPSLSGASEVRRCFLPHVERLAAVA